MQVKKITAKIRDMVKVSLMENGDERAWYNNIEMPDAIKELEMKDFHFHTLMDGKIEFQIHFEQGILPKDFPEKKARKHRNAAPATDTKPTEAAPVAAMPKPEEKPEDSTTALVAKPDGKGDTQPTATKPIDAKPAPTAASKPAAPIPAAKPAVKTDTKPTPAAPIASKPTTPKTAAKPDPKPAPKADGKPATKKAI